MKNTAIAAKVLSLVESGLNPEEVIAKLKEEEALKGGTYSDEMLDALITSEIRTISQPLAYREMREPDKDEVLRLLRLAYSADVKGQERFRSGVILSDEEWTSVVEDDSYAWMLVEAPSGFDVESDGTILGVCCFSYSGKSRRNGVVEGNLGSIRYLAVLPRFHGLYVATRLLQRVERRMWQLKCVRSMVCVSSKRESIQKWIMRRKYKPAGGMQYPPMLGYHLDDDTTSLVVFLKDLTAEYNCSADTADSKTFGKCIPEEETVLTLNTTAAAATASATAASSANTSDSATAAATGSSESCASDGKSRMHLPPHWRGITQQPRGVASTGSGPAATVSRIKMSQLSLDDVIAGTCPRRASPDDCGGDPDEIDVD